MTPDEALGTLRAGGLSEDDARVVVDHLAAADAAGRPGHGLSRVPWLVGLLGVARATRRPPGARRARPTGSSAGTASGRSATSRSPRSATASLADPPERARLVVAESCFPTGVLGAWARRLADAGLVAVVTATSPRRLPHPEGGPPLTGTNPIAIAVPSSDGRPFVADVSMGAVTHGDVLLGHGASRGPRPVRRPAGPQGVRARGRRSSCSSARSPGRSTARSSSRRVPAHDPVPGFRALAAGLRLPGDRR